MWMLALLLLQAPDSYWPGLLCGDSEYWKGLVAMPANCSQPHPPDFSGLLDDLYQPAPLVPLPPAWLPADRPVGFFSRTAAITFNEANAAAKGRDFLRAGQLYGQLARPGLLRDWDAVEGLGLCLLELGHPDQAIVHLEQVLKLWPGRLHASAGLTRAKQRIAQRARPVLLLQ